MSSWRRLAEANPRAALNRLRLFLSSLALPLSATGVLVVMGLASSHRSAPVHPDVHDIVLLWHVLPFAVVFALQALWLVRAGHGWESNGIVKDAVFLTLPFLLLTLLALPFGMRQFGGYDLSLLIDVGWRARLGQLPGEDYLSMLPPAFVATAEFGLLVSRDSFAGMVAIGAAQSILSVGVIVCALFRCRRADPATLSLAVCGTLAPFYLTTHLWHSLQASQAAAACVVSGAWVWRSPRSRWAYALLAVASGWALVCKPNLGPPAVVGVLVLLLLNPDARRGSILSFIGASGVALAVCLASRIHPFRLLEAYVEFGRGRAGLDMVLSGELPASAQSTALAGYVLPLLYLLIAWVPCGPSKRRNAVSADAAFGILGVLVAFVGFRSNWDVKQNDWPLYFVSVALLAPPAREAGLPSGAQPLLRQIAALTAVAFASWSCFSLGSSRLRNELVGFGAFFELATLARIDWGVLRGVHAGPRLHAVIDSARARARRHAPDGSVFFGPRMEFLYAQLGLPSPRGLPVWWHPGTSYHTRDSARILQAFIRNHFALAVFLKNDFTRMPAPLVDHIRSTYVRDDTHPDITVFHSPGALETNVTGAMPPSGLLGPSRSPQ